jgi:outer membrane biosynthesis protein TonB
LEIILIEEYFKLLIRFILIEKMKIKTKIKKAIAILLTVSLLMMQSSYAYVFAEDSAPVPPEAPSAPTPPPQPENNQTAPTPPQAPSAPTPPPQPENNQTAPTPPQNPSLLADQSADQSLSDQTATGKTGEFQGGNVGDTTIATGDASSGSTIINNGNQNLSSASGTGGTGGATVTNSDNGTGTVNSGSASVNNNNTTNQGNSASVNNNLDQSTVTGDNNSSFNVGNTTISTGDANTTGTIINNINTNIDGVAVYEFNIEDNHVGDIVLSYDPSNCISGCGTGNVSVSNTGNGTNSQNDANFDSTDNDTTAQNNQAEIGNDLTLVADSGKNDANFNTGGDSIITTGDANVEANVVTFANSNIAGNVVLGIVNIFGDLVGDIILTQDTLNSFCGGCMAGDTTVANSGNGDLSTNTTSVGSTSNQDISQFNVADIDNNVLVNANTGDNDTNFNTTGDLTITTGEANVDVSVLNIANTNIISGNWWLVLVNQAGKWIGQIVGADGQLMAGSEGLEFIVGDNGEISVANKDNGVGSVNDASVTSDQNTTINQTNDAKIVNNLELTANTGGNSASYNTGGDSVITTGDANVIANIINFVNTNIVGTGNLFVTVVNVFGSWLGNFIGPGYTKEASGSGSQPTSQQEVGGASMVSNSESSSSQSSSGSSDSTVGEISTEPHFTSGTSNSRASSGYISYNANGIAHTESFDNTISFPEEMGKVLGDRVNTSIFGVSFKWLLFLVPSYFLIAFLKRKYFATASVK